MFFVIIMHAMALYVIVLIPEYVLLAFSDMIDHFSWCSTSHPIPSLGNTDVIRTVLQWISVHCCIPGGEQAELVVKEGATREVKYLTPVI